MHALKDKDHRTQKEFTVNKLPPRNALQPDHERMHQHSSQAPSAPALMRTVASLGRIYRDGSPKGCSVNYVTCSYAGWRN